MPRQATLSPAEEHRILSRAEYVDGTMVRVECLRYTMPVLKKAGFTNPQPFHRYLVPICYREDAPQLRVAPPRSRM
jgi:hypothetical protein